MLVDSESDEDEVGQPDRNELNMMVHTLSAKLEDLHTCNDLIARHGLALTKTLSELESSHSSATDVVANLKPVQERATLFRITSNAMINVSLEIVCFLLFWSKGISNKDFVGIFRVCKKEIFKNLVSLIFSQPGI